jgi:hypothetical protein
MFVVAVPAAVPSWLSHTTVLMCRGKHLRALLKAFKTGFVPDAVTAARQSMAWDIHGRSRAGVILAALQCMAMATSTAYTCTSVIFEQTLHKQHVALHLVKLVKLVGGAQG